MPRVETIPFRVTQALFRAALKTDSTDYLGQELISAPFQWEGDWWVTTVIHKAMRHRWAVVYQVVPLSEWPENQETYVYGCFDEDWIARREATGSFWTGCIVQVKDHPELGQFVLGSCLTIYPEGSPCPGEMSG